MSDLYKARDLKQVQTLFGKIARRYDFANSVLSFNLHTLWNKRLTSSLRGPVLLDLCAGTGEIAYRFLKRQSTPHTAILLDFCPEMLQIAESKKEPYEADGHTLSFLQADAALIPLPDSSCDSISIAYGIRNVCDRASCLKEAHRVLKPGGTFALLELTEPKNPLLARLHGFYLNRILPKAGALLTNEPEAYSYLSTSIRQFIKPDELKQDLTRAGFHTLASTPLSFGIATLITAIK